MQITSFVSNKTFSQVQSDCIESDVQLRTKKADSELSNLYLLYSGDNGKNEFNGVILEKESNKIVCACQPRAHDVDFTEFSAKSKVSSQVKLEYCEDGPVVRLYFYNNKWYTATTKCIDGRDSYWASEKTFEEMFFDIFNKDNLNKLDTGFTYIFVLLHLENRIVVKHESSHLVFVGRINNETLQQDSTFDYTNSGFIVGPTIIDPLTFNGKTNTDALFNVYKRGLLLHVFDENSKCVTYKCDFPQYGVLKKLRGNIPDIEQRYIELLKEPQGLVMLEYYYYEHGHQFARIKQLLVDMITEIYNLYVESHIRHTIKITEEHLFHRTLKQLHAHHKQNKTPINIQIVKDKVLRMDTALIKKLLRMVQS